MDTTSIARYIPFSYFILLSFLRQLTSICSTIQPSYDSHRLRTQQIGCIISFVLFESGLKCIRLGCHLLRIILFRIGVGPSICFRISPEHRKRMTKTNMDRHRRDFSRTDNGLSDLHSQTDSPIKATAATNQNRLLSVTMAMRVISVMPT